jgi:hypothetical protein
VFIREAAMFSNGFPVESIVVCPYCIRFPYNMPSICS